MTENYLLFDKDDTGNKYVVSIHKIEVNLLSRDETAHITLDKGVGFFKGDELHIHTLEVTIESGGSGDGFFVPYQLANLLNNTQDIWDAGGDAISIFALNNHAGIRQLRLFESDGGALTAAISVNLPEDAKLYLDVRWNGLAPPFGDVTVDIWDNPGKTSFVDGINVLISGSRKDYRYPYAVNSYDTNSPSLTINGSVENLDLGVIAAKVGALINGGLISTGLTRSKLVH